MNPRTLASLSLLLGILLPARALCHGGLPLTSEILWRGDTILVPAQRWGVFVGSQAGPWHWICDEAINTNLLRNVYLGGDGTLYATDFPGMTVSRDGGCSWEAAPGEVANYSYLTVVTDPVAPARVWFAADANNSQAELWHSDDAARTWQRSYALPGWASAGLALHPDGKTIHLCALQLGATPQPAVHTSTDGGTSFVVHLIQDLPADVSPLQLYLLGADPRDPQVVYLRSVAGDKHVLLRADVNKGTIAELLRTTHSINAVTVDPSRDRLLIAATEGIYYADGAEVAQHSPALSFSECVSVHGTDVYACSSDYPPDLAAVARSTDGAQSFSKIFRFEDTQGIVDCPAGTAVAKTCPAIWAMYGPLLLNPPTMGGGADMATLQPDLGVPAKDGPGMQPAAGGCGVAGPGGAGPGGVLLLMGLLFRGARASR